MLVRSGAAILRFERGVMIFVVVTNLISKNQLSGQTLVFGGEGGIRLFH